MKAGRLKELLALVDDGEEVYIKVGDRRSELAALTYDGTLSLTSPVYMMDGDEVTVENMIAYLSDREKKNGRPRVISGTESSI